MDTDDEVYQWRLNELVRKGFTVPQAESLAASRCDLHEALELLARGCDRDIAFDLMSD